MPIYRKKRIILLGVVGILTPMVQPLSALSDTSNNTSIQTSSKNNDITNTQNKNDKKDFDNAHSSVLTSSDITPSQTESEGKNEDISSIPKAATDTTGVWGTAPWTMTQDGTLTIYEGEIDDVSKSPWLGKGQDFLKKIIFAGKVKAPVDSSGFFAYSRAISGDHYSYAPNMGIETIENLSLLDTSNVVNMDLMFFGLYKVKELDLSGIDTNNVTSMNQMFYRMRSVEKLDLSRFDTSKVTSMTRMFAESDELKELDLSGVDTHNVNNMSRMFDGVSLESLTIGSLTKFDNTVNLDVTKEPLEFFTGNWTLEDSKPREISLSDQEMMSDKPSLNPGTYVWEQRLVLGGDVIAKYVDTDGSKISDEVVKSGNVGENYSTEQKDIDGYTFKEVQGNPIGQFTDTPQTVTYVYTKNPVKAGDVTAHYVDTDANKISDDVVKSGNIGDDYSTEQKAIEGYTFKEVQGNQTGQFTDTPQTVTYMYTKNKVNPVKPIPDDNNPSHKEDTSKPESSSTHDALPETGENERMTLMSVWAGLILLMVALIASVFRFKRFKNNK